MLAFWISSAVCTAAVAEDFALAPEEGVLLLRNGNAIQGKITRVGEQFVVTLGPDGEMRLPVASVAQRARNMDELYFARLNALDHTSVDQRLELARWCVRQRHFARAADQLLAASLLNPADPRIGPLQRQVEMAAAPIDTAIAADKQAPVPPLHQFEETVRQLPAGAIETFTKTVQPMLLNRCASCHQPWSDTKYRLVRASGARTVAKRITQRNLAATLAMIDVHDPDNSLLLTKPSGTHGNTDALFDEFHQEQFELLRDWVLAVAASREPRRPHAVVPPDTALLQTGRTQRYSPDFTDPLLKDRRAEIARQMNLPDMADWTAENMSKTGENFQPRDPFDPQIFNRRHFADQPRPDAHPQPERLPPPDDTDSFRPAAPRSQTIPSRRN